MKHYETHSAKVGGVNLPKKAIIALLLSFAMLLCAPVLAFADTVKELKSGQSVTASADNSFFKYTATKDGRVAFVTGNDDTTYSCIELYKYENKTSRIDYSYNDSWRSEYNSRIIYNMKAGQTVYLSCEGEDNWSYPVEAINDDHNLALARPYMHIKNSDSDAGSDTVGIGADGQPRFDLCIKANKGEKHLVQGEDFKIEGYKTDWTYGAEESNTSWSKEKPTVSGGYFVKAVGINGFKGSTVFEIIVYIDEKDSNNNSINLYSKEYSNWSNGHKSTRSDAYATAANGNTLQGEDFLNNPLAAVSAWINGAWKTLTEGTDYEFSKDNITATDDPNWFQATIKGIGDWANSLETNFLFRVCDHHNLVEHEAVKPNCANEQWGYVHRWECKDCGLFFADKDAKQVLSDDEMVIDYEHKWSDWKTAKEATCEDRGYKERACSVCNHTETDEIEPTGHNVTKWTITKEPTFCTNWDDGDGERTGICSICHQTITEQFGKEHDWGEWQIDTPVRCDEDGHKFRICNECGKYDYETIKCPNKNHDWGEWGAYQEPTCEEWGSKQRQCKTCGLIDTEYAGKPQHSWDEGKVTKQATHTEVGIKTYTCKTCGITKTEGIPNESLHVWDKGEVTDPATCKKVGTMTYTCKTCGETKTKAVPKSDHKWDAGAVTTAATCDKAGVKTYTCSTCGTAKTETIPATGKHSYDAKATKQPTCTEDGVRTLTCKNCGDVKTEAIKATGHKWDAGAVTTAATCDKAGVKTYRCTNANCKETKTEAIPATGHKFGDWKVVKAAAENVKGSEERTCSVCGAKETREIAALPASVKSGTTAAVSGATVTVASTAPAKTPSGATAAGTVTYKKPTNANASSVTVPATVNVQGKTYVVTQLDSYAFKNNKKVKTVKLPTTITQISGSAFSGCTALKSVSLPNVTTIGASAFKGAKSLTSVSTGKNLRTIGASAFSSAKKLKTLTVTSKSLTKKSVKGSLKGSSVKTVKVKVGSKKANKTYVKKYKKIFTKGNAGKKASVK